MSSITQAQDSQNTRDNLNPADTEGDPLIIIRKKENAYIEENSSIIELRDVSADTIWGAFNWGAANWDNTYTSDSVKWRVINPNNIFREYLRDTAFVDTSATTATVSATTYDITFASSGDIFQSTQVYMNNQIITRATLYISSDNITNSSRLSYYLSSDNGVSWDSATLNTECTITTASTILVYKIIASGTASIVINDVYGISKPIQLKYVTSG
jgi:hypothetical protein